MQFSCCQTQLLFFGEEHLSSAIKFILCVFSSLISASLSQTLANIHWLLSYPSTALKQSNYMLRNRNCAYRILRYNLWSHVFFLCIQSNGDLKRKWTWAVEWLGDELERRPYTGNPQYTYNNWSPPVQSNETSNGYFLERSHSARMTLAKACELCPEEVKALTFYPSRTRTLLPNFTLTLSSSLRDCA